MAEVLMPRLSDSMDEGTVLKWLKSVGDEVAVGEELVEIETDKATMVYEADTAGTLIEILAEQGETLPIGAVIARIGDQTEAASNGVGRDQTPASSAEGGRTPEEDTASATTTSNAPGRTVDVRVKASPVAKRLAAESDLSLQSLVGSGPGGRIVKADVEVALASGPAPTPRASEKVDTGKGQVDLVELTKLQQTVARRMTESKATAPHFYLQAEIDMTAAVEGRAALKASAKEGDIVPTFNDMIVKACALALREQPRANGAYRDGRIELYSRVNVGVAVAAQDALIVSTVFDADRKGLRQIAIETRALAARVRDGSITPPELSGGTFTVSNLGMYGISNFHAVVNTPQAGILAVGELKPKPVVTESGGIEARHLMGVTLACDHRILYGADGAVLLARVRELLTSPLRLAL